MWWEIQSRVLQKPVHTDILIRKSSVPHPKYSGFGESFGERICQAHWRKGLSDNKCLHICEFERFYLVHWDWVDPRVNPIGRLILDAPHIAIPLGKLIWDYLTE